MQSFCDLDWIVLVTLFKRIYWLPRVFFRFFQNVFLQLGTEED